MKYFLIMFIMLWATSVFAAPHWAEKPIQCALPEEVFARLDRDGLVPLFSSIGNARVENDIYTKMYAMLYNADNGKWAFIEFFDNETTCIIVVGEGVDFDVMSDKTKDQY
jgi:hypothetical protein